MNGESVKVTSGCRLVLDFQYRGMDRHFMRDIYWKHGLIYDTFYWLRDNFGDQCNDRSLWNNDDPEDGQWIYLGTQIRNMKTRSTVTLQFRTTIQAIMFKLVWAGRL